MIRFIVSFVWLVLVLGVVVFAFIVAQPLIGAIAELIIAIITFMIPYLRRKGTLTRWWGWLALLSAISLTATSFGL